MYVEPLTEVLLGVSQLCTNLRELTIYAHCPLTGFDVVALYKFPHLKHLDVFLTSRVLDEHVIPVALKLSTLIVNERVSQNFLPALGRSCITEFHMMGRSQCYLQSDLRVFLENRRDFLTCLTLRCNELNDRSYIAIAACHNLLELKLYSCHLLRWKSACRLVSLTKLQVLHLTGARMLWMSMMKCFLIFLKAPITTLCLSATSFTDEHVDVLGEKFPGLKSLELWRNKLTGSGVVKLSTKLQELTVLDTDVALTEEELLKIGGHVSLRRLRCCTPYHEPRCAPRSVEVTPVRYGVWCVAGGVRVVEARAPAAGSASAWLRGGGEGPAASLFHYSNVDDFEEPSASYRLPDIFDFG